MPDNCCDKLDTAVADGKIRYDGKQWHTVSSSVFMCLNIKFCMWCGLPMPVVKRRRKPPVTETQVNLFTEGTVKK